jgi:hypothetical protein
MIALVGSARAVDPLSLAETAIARKKACDLWLERVGVHMSAVETLTLRLRVLLSAAPDSLRRQHAAWMTTVGQRTRNVASLLTQQRALSGIVNKKLENRTGECPQCVAADLDTFCKRSETAYADITPFIQDLENHEDSLKIAMPHQRLIARVSALVDSSRIMLGAKGASCPELHRAENLLRRAIETPFDPADITYRADMALEAAIAARRIVDASACPPPPPTNAPTR